jgi:hypothetical protein
MMPGSIQSTATGAPQITTSDRIRQVTVTLSEIACVVGTLSGTGVLGTPVESTAGGRLSADATLLAPAGPAFSIWSVIYLGLAAYTGWQWLPSVAATARARRTGWLAAASMLLNAAWLLVTQLGWIWVSVVVIVVLLGVLYLLVRRLGSTRAERPSGTPGILDRIILDGTFGVYLGWVSVATFANLAAALADTGIEVDAAVAEVLAVLAVLVVAGVGVAWMVTLGGSVAVAGAMVWGLAWVVVGRTAGDPRSVAVAVAAVVAAVVVVAAAVRTRRNRPTPALPT